MDLERPTTDPTEPSATIVRTLREAFREHLRLFGALSRRAHERFEHRDWVGHQRDASERLDLYGGSVAATLTLLAERLGDRLRDEALWIQARALYARQIETSEVAELKQTYFNSVARRLFGSQAGEALEFRAPPAHLPPPQVAHVAYAADRGLPTAIGRLLRDYRFSARYVSLVDDVARVSREIRAFLDERGRDDRLLAIETLRPIYYRQKLAFVVGRLRMERGLLPCVICLDHGELGVAVDAVLLDEDRVSILFSFARSYFLVDTAQPSQHVAFLRSVLPRKPVAELYSSLGYNRHGKTALFRDLQRHLLHSKDRFEFAPGTRGMVMLVFTPHDYDVVFKVIRDEFDYPKQHRRKQVLERYRLVFRHDRVGRLVDAQEYEDLEFDRRRFEPELLEALCTETSRSVVLEGDTLRIRHLYTERQVTPLNLYLERMEREDPAAAERAALDYGYAIKELAAANIFPGDFLLKNFGVTRHERVVFYDYDELCLLTDCNFRHLPPPRFDGQELENEPWFTVRENDIFPEEFARFLGLREPLKGRFLETHPELFSVEFWRGLQESHRRGEVLDVFPYPPTLRLARGDRA